MITTYSITHHLLQFLVVAAWSSSNQVLPFLLPPLKLFVPPSLQQVQDSSRLLPHLPEASSPVNVPSHPLPFSHVRFCPFLTRLLVEGMPWAPMLINHCVAVAGQAKKPQWFLVRCSQGSDVDAEELTLMSFLRNASC